MIMLPVRPKPKPNEHLLGYIFRLVHVNGVRLRGFTRAFGMKFTDIDLYAKGQVTDNLQAMTGHAREMFSFFELHKNRSYTDAFFYSRLFKICPTCFKAHGYIHSTWQLYAFTTCTIHNEFLRSHCHSCGECYFSENLYNFKCHECSAPMESVHRDEKLIPDKMSEMMTELCAGTFKNEACPIPLIDPAGEINTSYLTQFRRFSETLATIRFGNYLYQEPLPDQEYNERFIDRQNFALDCITSENNQVLRQLLIKTYFSDPTEHYELKLGANISWISQRLRWLINLRIPLINTVLISIICDHKFSPHDSFSPHIFEMLSGISSDYVYQLAYEIPDFRILKRGREIYRLDKFTIMLDLLKTQFPEEAISLGCKDVG